MALIKVSELSSTGSVKIDDILMISSTSGSGYTSNHISIGDLVSSQPFVDLSSSGTAGSSGTSGSNGSSGTSGINGTSGSNGSSGTSGINGTSGSSGTSLIWNFLGTYQVQIHNVGDVVTFDGQTWYCIQYAPSGAGPFGGYIGVYWTLISASGSNGSDGTSGSNGTDGTSGSNGSSGTSGISGLSGTTGSWTVTPGTNNYSFTVDINNTYNLWVLGNIPNGIIVYNATVTISNSNVPVLGVQYAWNYTGAGSPILITNIPAQIIGTAGAISTASPAVGTSTNTFVFGIQNTTGSNVTVNYGYLKIS